MGLNPQRAPCVQLLSFTGCPGIEPALARLKRVLAEAGLDVPIDRIEVADEQTVCALRFLGSPSIRINGLDIEDARRADPPCFGCRLYPPGEPVPSKAMIRTALEHALAPKTRILFLCTGNACRSQMAEGWARALKGDQLEVYSAGIETHGLNPYAVRVMGEAGVDISGHHSKTVEDLAEVTFDYVVTVCGHAHESCPVFAGSTNVVHRGFDDPPRLAVHAATAEEALAHYRRVRDEIHDYIQTLPDSLKTSRSGWPQKGAKTHKND